jgi:hypothetical protein
MMHDKKTKMAAGGGMMTKKATLLAVAMPMADKTVRKPAFLKQVEWQRWLLVVE